MDVLAVLGRILFSAIFISSGINHLTKRQHMSEYASQMGVPSPMAAVVISGLMILVGGIMVLLGIWADLGALLVAIFLLLSALMMHAPWKFTDPQMKQQQQVHFFKNLSMLGGALITMAWFACSDAAVSLTGPLFG